MKIAQSFEVQAPVEQVWAALIDLERVGPCVPGASISERGDDGTYRGTFEVRLGPATAAYSGTIRVEDVDEAARRATLKAHGTDKRGQGGATATIVNSLAEFDGGTRVESVMDVMITGRLASFGRAGIIQDVSSRLLGEFAACLQSQLATPPQETPTSAATTSRSADASQPLRGGSLLLSVLWMKLRRAFGRR